MSKKVTLPVAAPDRHKRPSVDVARARLGGRMTGEPSPPAGLAPGELVAFTAKDGARGAGVVLFASAMEVLVIVSAARLRRLTPADVAPHEGAAAAGELAAIAADARVFATLAEGQAVRYTDEEGTLRSGRLAEKCRYGALVVRDDGTVVAVGFRKLWPLPAGGAGAS